MSAWSDAANFLNSVTPEMLPKEFELHPHVMVRDAERFLRELKKDLAFGLKGARARTGALQEDINALWRVLNERQ